MEGFLFRKVLPRDIWDIYEISNDPTVRRLSINQKPIEREEHINWFQSVDKSLFFVLERDGKVIGQIRFNRKGERTFEVSISVHPLWRKQGLGKILLKEGLKRVFKLYPNAVVVAKIRVENTVSKKLFKSLGFEFLHREGDLEVYRKTRQKAPYL